MRLGVRYLTIKYCIIFIFSNLTFLFFFIANKKSIIDERVLDNISNNAANA